MSDLHTPRFPDLGISPSPWRWGFTAPSLFLYFFLPSFLFKNCLLIFRERARERNIDVRGHLHWLPPACPSVYLGGSGARIPSRTGLSCPPPTASWAVETPGGQRALAVFPGTRSQGQCPPPSPFRTFGTRNRAGYSVSFRLPGTKHWAGEEARDPGHDSPTAHPHAHSQRAGAPNTHSLSLSPSLHFLPVGFFFF